MANKNYDLAHTKWMCKYHIVFTPKYRRKISCIIVKDLSRFERDYLEMCNYLELILPVFNTRFISIKDNYDSDNYVGTTGGMDVVVESSKRARVKIHIYIVRRPSIMNLQSVNPFK